MAQANDDPLVRMSRLKSLIAKGNFCGPRGEAAQITYEACARQNARALVAWSRVEISKKFKMPVVLWTIGYNFC